MKTQWMRIGLLALAIGTAAEASSIVSDGGFEVPSLGNYTVTLGDGWTVAAGTIQIFNTADGEGAVPHSGSQFAYLGFGETANTLSQALATAIGQSYMISYWVADNDPNSLSVSFGGQTLFSGTSPTNGVGSAADYVNYTFVETATSTSTNLNFSGEWLGFDGDYGTILDDVTVTAVGTPEPGTIALLGIGFIALSAIRPRRR